MKMENKRLTCLIVISFVILTIVSACRHDKGPVVCTSLGKIRGVKTESAELFLGIPFAKPPVDDLRWAAPQDPEPWHGVLDATESRSICTQAERLPTWQTVEGQFRGSEDCLYLNVYRPDNTDEDLPVYVYFHGGANRFGGAAGYGAPGLAAAQNIIVVVPQYRLGPLGWLSHPALRSEDGSDPAGDSGNFGTLDNIKALEWVRQHIDRFGGDPDRVTIGGQSAGAANVAKLLCSPLAEGLFQGAFIQSIGGDVIPPTKGDARTEQLLTLLGYNSENGDIESFLRSIPAADLIAAYDTVDTDGDGEPDGTIAGFVDGTVIPKTYIESFFDDTYNKVPVVLGNTASEFKDFLPLYGPSLGYPQWANVYDLFDPDFDPEYEWTWDEIFLTQDADGNTVDTFPAYQQIATMQTSIWKVHQVDELAKLLQQRQDDVYAFLFRWGEAGSASPEFSKVFGAAHSSDVPFFLGADRTYFGYALTEENRAGFEALQQVMMTYLGNFVKTGTPGTVDGTTWEEWSNEAITGVPKCMVFDADMSNAIIGMNSEELTPADIGEQDVYYLNQYGYDLLTPRLTSSLFPLPGLTTIVDAGVNDGAGYVIELPETWAPGDDLVMYAHGYRGDGPQLTVSPPFRLRAHLIANNYAWAASSYTRNGYDIVSGVESTDALLEYFKEQHGQPGRVYIIGHSMGGHVTARIITDTNYADNYTAAMPMCGVVGGGTDLFTYQLDWGLLSSYYAGLDFEVPWTDPDTQQEAFLGATFGGALGLIPDNDPFGTNPPLTGVEKELTPAVLTEAGMNLRDAIMYRSGGQRPLFENTFSHWAAAMIPYSTERLITPYFEADPTLGTISGNASIDYQLDMDSSNINELEAALNDGIARLADPIRENFETLMWPVSGDIQKPVLSLHDIGDMFVPFSMEQLWAERIAANDKQDMFVSRAIRAVGHCDFTVAEEQQAFMDLVSWVNSIETASPSIPGGDDILNAETVADPAFGCVYTSEGRAYEDPDFQTECGQ